MFFGGMMPNDADASAAHFGVPAYGGEGGAASHSGNGKFNRNSFIVYSPSISHDVQHIRNVNVDGNTVTAAAICKKPARRCTIVQRLGAFDR
jgi:hypothetical protein